MCPRPVSCVCGRMKMKTQDFLAFSQHAPTTLHRTSSATQERPETQATFSSILTRTFDSENAKPSYRTCTYTPTFTALAVCSSLSLSCYARTQTASLMHRAQFLSLYILRQNMSNHHSPQAVPSHHAHHSTPPHLTPRPSQSKGPTMLHNIILTVNFVRSRLFPTGHVSLTWEHRVFLPSAEGSSEKRRLCHTPH